MKSTMNMDEHRHSQHQVPQIRHQSQHESDYDDPAANNAEVGTAMTPMASGNQWAQTAPLGDPAAVYQREEDLTFGSFVNDRTLDVAEMMQVADVDKKMPKSFLQAG